MPLSAEERYHLESQLPNFGSSEKLQYLAERKLLPQQQDNMESFENPSFLTRLRREVFGHTGREQALIKRQQEAIVPFEQEQKLKAALAPILQTPLTELLQSPIGQGIVPTRQQIGAPTGQVTVPQDMVPSTFDIDELMARQTVGKTPSNIVVGQPGAVVSRPITEKLMPHERTIDVVSNELIDPSARPTMLQALQAQAQLEPSVMAANVRKGTPEAQSPMGKLLADFGATKPGTPQAETLARYIEGQIDPEAVQNFKAALFEQGIKKGTPEWHAAFQKFSEKLHTNKPAMDEDYRNRLVQAQGELATGKDSSRQAAARIALKYNVQTDDVLKAMKDPNRPLVGIDMKQESAESAGVGKGFSEAYNELMKSGMEANAKIARLDRLSQLLEGVTTGKLIPSITTLEAIGKTFGIDIDPTLGAKQAVQALAAEMALQLRNPSGGAGMPGGLSNADREYLLSMAPNLDKTPEGNRLIIETARKLAKRDQEVSKLAREYRKKNGHMDEGFYDVLEEFSNKNPLFQEKAQESTSKLSPEEQQELEALRKLLGK